jgi:hypothetical protein
MVFACLRSLTKLSNRDRSQQRVPDAACAFPFGDANKLLQKRWL